MYTIVYFFFYIQSILKCLLKKYKSNRQEKTLSETKASLKDALFKENPKDKLELKNEFAMKIEPSKSNFHPIERSTFENV